MARRPPQQTPRPVLGFLRLPGAARRYVAAAEYEAARAGRAVETISHRAFEQMRLRREFGIETREAHTKALKRGRVAYRTTQARAAATYAREVRPLRGMVTGVTRADLRLMNDKRRNRPVDAKKFARLFSRYSRSQVLEALGSPEDKDTSPGFDLGDDFEAAE